MSFWGAIAWRPQIGDPSVMGWVTVILYAVAAYYCIRIGFFRGADFRRHVKRQFILWRTLGLVLVLLCVNKQLDLQTFLTEVAKYYFRQHGLYEARRQFQLMFIGGLLAIGFISFFMLLASYRKVLRDNLLAIIGATFLMVYVVVRAASFHQVDRLIGSSILGVKLNWMFEIFGLVLIVVCARRQLGRGKGSDFFKSDNEG